MGIVIERGGSAGRPCIEGTEALKVSAAGEARVARNVPEETPVALVYDGTTHAVMMASPIDLADFAVGFSLTEGIVRRAAEIGSLEIVEHASGIELRMWLVAEAGMAQSRRRRALVGPTACGLCGIESLESAVRQPQRVDADLVVSAADIRSAMEGLVPLQALNQMTGAVHGAAFWQPGRGVVLIREDVGRHNALDKLAGAMVREGLAAETGVAVLTSRVSVEMVQKAAALGVPVVAAVSAPTALAIRTAEAAGITLIAVARRDAFEIFTHPNRIAGAFRSGVTEHHHHVD